jgi:two-component system chemotaxis response regulator CheB
VKEAQEGDQVVPGRVLIAPGNYHMELYRSGAYYHVKLHQEAPLHSVRPAADYMMKSVAKYVGKNACGVVLTGMGKDGAEGLLEMHKAGAYCVAQNEETCVVYGMPQAAFNLGATDKVLPLDKIAGDLLAKISAKDAA